MTVETQRIAANGVTFTVLTGGSGPRLALLLHGFPDDARSMVPLLGHLVKAGWRVVAPFMRGYGPTTRGDGDYSLGALSADVVGLIEALSAGPALVVGHDWGALTAYAVANLAPERLTGLVALSVPPPRALWTTLRRRPLMLWRSWYAVVFQVPGLAERLVAARDFAFVEWLWRAWSSDWRPSPERLAEVKKTLRTPGTLRAALGYYRHLRRVAAATTVAERRLRSRLLSRLRVPSLVLAGRRDGCISADVYRGIERAFTGPIEVRLLPGAGHWLPLESTTQVARSIEWAASRWGVGPSSRSRSGS